MYTVTMTELRASGTSSWSVKDNSVRGITVKYIDDVKPGDEVVIDNHFTLVVTG